MEARLTTILTNLKANLKIFFAAIPTTCLSKRQSTTK